jgi:hypothetical protein
MLPALGRRVAAVDCDELDFTGPAPAERSSLFIFRGLEALDALLEGREFDHHKTIELVRTFHDLNRPPRARNRPPYLAMTEGERSVYFLNAIGSMMRARAIQ